MWKARSLKDRAADAARSTGRASRFVLARRVRPTDLILVCHATGSVTSSIRFYVSWLCSHAPRRAGAAGVWLDATSLLVPTRRGQRRDWRPTERFPAQNHVPRRGERRGFG